MKYGLVVGNWVDVCTLHTVHCTLYIVQCTLYTVYIVHCKLYTVHCTLYTVHLRYTQYTVKINVFS